MSRKFTAKSELTSPKMPDGKYYTFAPGDVIDEKYIVPSMIDGLIAKGILTDTTGNAVEAPAKVVIPKKASVHKKSAARKTLDKSLAGNTEKREGE